MTPDEHLDKVKQQQALRQKQQQQQQALRQKQAVRQTQTNNAPNKQLGSQPQVKSQQSAQATTNKKQIKPPVSSGKAFALGLLASFIVCVIMAGILVTYSIIQANEKTNQEKAFLQEQQNTINNAVNNISLSPTKESVEKAKNSIANITVVPNSSAEGSETYGTGIILSATGDIVTNNHVVSQAKSIKVNINGTSYDAEISGSDATSDIATLKIDAKNLTSATIGKSKDLIDGDWVMAIGNPYGLNSSLSTGSVSALGRDFSYDSGTTTIMYANMIQTDASINPGNSGGGLFNSSGELIGLTTLITSQDGTSSGIGYAIPIDYVVPITKNLIAGQPAQHSALGVSMSAVPDDAVNKFGLSSKDGAYITNVVAAGPAANAGLAIGDIVTSFNGKPILNDKELLFKVRSLPVNTSVEMKILREGKEMSFNIRLGSDA